MALCGGWTVNQNIPEANLDDDLKKIFKEATGKLLGSKYVCLDFLGSQVVNGVNYKYLAYVSAAGTHEEDVEKDIVNVTIHASTDGTLKVTKVKDVFDD